MQPPAWHQPNNPYRRLARAGLQFYGNAIIDTLTVSLGQYSDKGRKAANQDFHGALIPEPPLLHMKGLVVALADGISSSSASAIAAETAVKSLLTDYYCTADSWPVRTAAQRVIAAVNSWLHTQGQAAAHPDDPDRGYVCTLSALILKSRSAHILHVGDSRIGRVIGRSLEPLTRDHRSGAYLARALGVGPNIEIDYLQLALMPGDIFVLTTDGGHDFVDGSSMADSIARHSTDLDTAAREIATLALDHGSTDNLTIQILRVDTLPPAGLADHLTVAPNLPLPPRLVEQDEIDGLRVIRQLHGNARSSVHLVQDTVTQRLLALKVPVADDPHGDAYLRQFLMEEWIARRLNSPHVLKSVQRETKPSALYLLTDYIDGQTLTQRMRDNPRPSLTSVRDIIGQLAKGLTAFHRQSMIHQDLRPDNVLIDATGTATIIDFGATSVAGVSELDNTSQPRDWPGTVQYTAPECLLGAPGSVQSDLFSLGVIAYQMLVGRLPYGDAAARVQNDKDLWRLQFEPFDPARNIPLWVEAAIERAVAVNPQHRYAEASELVYDLTHPNAVITPPAGTVRPMAERLRFWQTTCLVLVCAVGVLLLILILMVG
ncbi:MAG: bifunctional protein-serine/threonine kinase/phosphatase [Devosia sp.]|nr:bifunctional protein-serine/threonine kinase/phosphatase [Devosia sp.]